MVLGRSVKRLTVGFLLDMADPSHLRLRTHLRLGGLLGFLGGFMLAYQRSSCAFPKIHLPCHFTDS